MAVAYETSGTPSVGEEVKPAPGSRFDKSFQIGTNYQIPSYEWCDPVTGDPTAGCNFDKDYSIGTSGATKRTRSPTYRSKGTTAALQWNSDSPRSNSPTPVLGAFPGSYGWCKPSLPPNPITGKRVRQPPGGISHLSTAPGTFNLNPEDPDETRTQRRQMPKSGVLFAGGAATEMPKEHAFFRAGHARMERAHLQM
jgi:hypothetical protein